MFFFSAFQMYKSSRKPILSSYVLVISVHIAKILQVQVFQSFISPLRSHFQQVTYITTHTHWNGIHHYPKNPILCEKS